MPLSACKTTFGNQLSRLCTESGTDGGLLRLRVVRLAGVSACLSPLRGGEGADDVEGGGEGNDGLAKIKVVCCKGRGRVTPDEELDGSID